MKGGFPAHFISMREKSHIAVRNESAVSVENCMSEFETRYEAVLTDPNIPLKMLFAHLSKSSGKKMRPRLFFLSQGLISGSLSSDVRIAVMLELLHRASLLHDDVVDNSAIRRGLETINARFGNKVSILAGDMLFAEILRLGVDIDSQEVLSRISDVASGMSRAELTVAMTSLEDAATTDFYFKNIRDKTAALFGAACSLGAFVAGGSKIVCEKLQQIGVCYGMIFQIRDDILDLTGSPRLLGKPVQQDIESGNITLPLIKAIEHAAEDKQQHILQLLEDKDNSQTIKAFIKDNGGVNRSLQEIERISGKIRKLLHSFPASPFRDRMEQLTAEEPQRKR